MPLASLGLAIFLMVENAKDDDYSGLGKALATIGVIGAATSVAYGFWNPAKFSDADPTGCYWVDGKPVFQLRGGNVLFPSGAGSGAKYKIEPTDVGLLVVTDHEFSIAKSDDSVLFRIGAAEARYTPSIDTLFGPAMMLAPDGRNLQINYAYRRNRC